VIFAPRVLAFRPTAERTTTREADVWALVRMLGERLAPSDYEAFDAATRGASSAEDLDERFRDRDWKTRDALAAWMDVARTSLSRRIDWVLGIADVPETTAISAFDEIAARLGSSHRVVIKPPERDDPSFMLDSEMDWEMQRLAGRGAPSPWDPFPSALSTLLYELEKLDNDGLEWACKTILLNRLVGIRRAENEQEKHRPKRVAPPPPPAPAPAPPLSPVLVATSAKYQCPKCGSSDIAYEELEEFTTLKCGGCGHDAIVDLIELAEWR